MSSETPQSDPFTVSAHEAINLKYVRRGDSIAETPSTNPTYVHQLFEDEKITGYKGLTIDVYQSSESFVTYVNVRFEEKKPKAPLLTQILNEYFPGGYSTSLAEFERDINKPFRPLGNKIHEYTRELGGQRFSYKSYHMVFENPSTRAFFDRLQVNSVWNIENASLIDVESDDNWEAICTYKMHEDGSYELVGYATIYFFYAYPDKSRLRISQVVVFPQHRRQRHASELLKTIYLIGNVRNVVEFTVEDISEEFRIVRAMVDIRNIHDLGFWKTAQELESPSNASQEIQKRLKLHKRQVNECLEILRLGATNVHDQAKYKAYRLSIKRRIYMQQIGSNNRKGVEKEDEEDEENEEKIKQGLHDLYLETEALYRKVLDALDK